MPAIPVHHTPTVDEPWDKAEMVRRLKGDTDAAYYRRMYAWVDPEADPETKAAYKFPHHMVSEGGDIGAANVRACINGIAVLNGARGGANIPDDDREGVYRHLAAHLRDAGVEPPDLRSLQALAQPLQRRGWRAHELRAEDGKGGPVLRGYAAVFEQEAEIWDFYEVISRGAFADYLSSGGEVVALWNHDTNYVLGRRSAGTLKVWEDDHGLAVEIYPPDAQWARDLAESVRRGDVKQMSFSFRVREGGEEWYTRNGRVVRRLNALDLFDVSPVTFPAYPQTAVWAREDMEHWLAEWRRIAAPGAAGAGSGRGAQDALQVWARLARYKLELAKRL